LFVLHTQTQCTSPAAAAAATAAAAALSSSCFFLSSDSFLFLSSSFRFASAAAAATAAAAALASSCFFLSSDSFLFLSSSFRFASAAAAAGGETRSSPYRHLFVLHTHKHNAHPYTQHNVHHLLLRLLVQHLVHAPCSDYIHPARIESVSLSLPRGQQTDAYAQRP
jgi:hypothetical protein